MFGLLTLSEPVLCQKEVLGQSFECCIAGIRAQLFFPQYPPVENPLQIGHDNPLLPPSWLKQSDTSITWGEPLQHPLGDSGVQTLALFVECDSALEEEYAKKLYTAIERWEFAFIDYLRLDTKQGIGRDKNTHRKACNLELHNKHYIPNNQMILFYFDIPCHDNFASKKSIKQAIKYADSGKEFSLEYQMLLASYDARKNRLNRLAILNACSAAELHLVNQIETFCKSKGLDSGILLNKYRSLGERFDLVKKVNDSFPKIDYSVLIVHPRNSLMHNRDINPDDKTTDALITSVREYLEFYQVALY